MRITPIAGWLLLAAGCKDVSASPTATSSSSSRSIETPSASTTTTTSTSTSTSVAPRPARACPMGEVEIAATGPDGFVMGLSSPERRVVISKAFCIDADEVSVQAYKECVDAGKCALPRMWGMWLNYPTKLDHPVNKVGWRDARAYCQFRGKDLPTEAQWEWAATGGDGRNWPWGNDEPTCEHADFTPGNLEGPSSNDGCHGGGTSPIGTHPKGDRVTPDGRIHDLAGNAWEWTLDNFGTPPPGKHVDPVRLVAENSPHVTRGGAWNRSGRGITTRYRAGAPVDYQVPSMGMRCVRPR
jgi:formylglycine-generating enzyme required for sulfatase activity